VNLIEVVLNIISAQIMGSKIGFGKADQKPKVKQ
jgi:hypothetical protein